MSIRNLDFFYGDNRALKNISLPLYDQQGDGLHRPVRLRQVDAAARAQPHVRPLSEPARRRARSCSTARTSCRRSRTSTCCARASAWCSRSRRRSRCRSTRTSPSASGSTRGCRKAELDDRVENALQARRAVGRGQGQARCQRAEPVRRPAAAPVHRAHGRGAARGDPARRAVLGARSDRDRQDRGADRRAEGGLHASSSSPTTCSRRRASRDFTAFMYLGELVEFDADQQDLHRAAATGARRTTSPAASAEPVEDDDA